MRGPARNSKNRTKTQAIVGEIGGKGLEYLLSEINTYTAKPGNHKEVIDILRALKSLAPEALRSSQRAATREGTYRDPPALEGDG